MKVRYYYYYVPDYVTYFCFGDIGECAALHNGYWYRSSTPVCPYHQIPDLALLLVGAPLG